MICFCGDSYSENNGAELVYAWHRQLAKKIYGDKYLAKYINLAHGGRCNDHIIENQLIGKVLSKYPHSPLEYLIIGFTFPERFKLTNTISWTPAQGTIEDIKQMAYIVGDSVLINLDEEDTTRYFIESSIKRNITLYNDNFVRRRELLNPVLNLIKKCGTKIFLFDNYNTLPNCESSLLYSIDDYCERININKYINPSLDVNDYSNHFALENNNVVAENFYKEIMNK
jgi:hypothetical protein